MSAAILLLLGGLAFGARATAVSADAPSAGRADAVGVATDPTDAAAVPTGAAAVPTDAAAGAGEAADATPRTVAGLQAELRRWLEMPWGRDELGAAVQPRQAGRRVDCGSFVIAVLRRVGVRVSRSLARAPALRILEAVAADGKIQRWRGSVPALEHHLRQRGAGVYLLGLSHHIAFAVVHDDQVSLMHASRRAGQVIAEHLSTSTAVLSSRRSEIFVAALALTE